MQSCKLPVSKQNSKKDFKRDLTVPSQYLWNVLRKKIWKRKKKPTKHRLLAKSFEGSTNGPRQKYLKIYEPDTLKKLLRIFVQQSVNKQKRKILYYRVIISIYTFNIN